MAILELILFKIGLKVYHIVGMLILLIMTLCIALSDVFGPNVEEVKLSEIEGDSVPIYVAVLNAFLFPVVGSVMVMLLKYVNTVLRPTPLDWVQYVTVWYGLIGTILGSIHFILDPESFRLKYLIQGFIAGVLTMIGATLIVTALSLKGAPTGPTIALINSQVMYLVVLDAILKQTIPFYL